MENRKMRTMLSVLLSILFVAACSPAQTDLPTTTVIPVTEESQATATSPAAATAATESAGMPVAGEGLCANAYYPVREGATWTYKSTGGPAGEYSFTDTITSARDDGFTLSTQLGDLTRTQEWTCGPGGLLALQLGGAPAAMLNSQGVELSLDVTDTSGVTFPSQINPGDQWQQNAAFEGNMSLMGQGGTATGNGEMNFTAIGNEPVTIPAGTFDALKIEVDTTLDFDVSYQGLSVPVIFAGTYTYWFAPGVGWVKASGMGSVAGTSFSETTELQSYSVP